jgi:hypothetical protein
MSLIRHSVHGMDRTRILPASRADRARRRCQCQMLPSPHAYILAGHYYYYYHGHPRGGSLTATGGQGLLLTRGCQRSLIPQDRPVREEKEHGRFDDLSARPSIAWRRRRARDMGPIPLTADFAGTYVRTRTRRRLRNIKRCLVGSDRKEWKVQTGWISRLGPRWLFVLLMLLL